MATPTTRRFEHAHGGFLGGTKYVEHDSEGRTYAYDSNGRHDVTGIYPLSTCMCNVLQGVWKEVKL